MKSNKKYYITLTVIALLVLLAIVNNFWQSDNSSVSGSCGITDIEYRDVSPVECWNEDLNSTYCPLPKNLVCSFTFSGLGDLLISIVKNID